MPSAITDHQTSGVLEIVWADGAVSQLAHGVLRLQCRCASCEQQRRAGQLPVESDPNVRLSGIDPVGDKGLNLVFSDGHRRGIYPWLYLRELGDLSK